MERVYCKDCIFAYTYKCEHVRVSERIECHFGPPAPAITSSTNYEGQLDDVSTAPWVSVFPDMTYHDEDSRWCGKGVRRDS